MSACLLNEDRLDYIELTRRNNERTFTENIFAGCWNGYCVAGTGGHDPGQGVGYGECEISNAHGVRVHS